MIPFDDIYDSLSNATGNGKVSSIGGSVTYTIRIFFHVFQIHMFCIKNTGHFFKGEHEIYFTADAAAHCFEFFSRTWSNKDNLRIWVMLFDKTCS